MSKRKGRWWKRATPSYAYEDKSAKRDSRKRLPSKEYRDRRWREDVESGYLEREITEFRKLPSSEEE